MENQDKTFEFNLQGYKITGSITKLTDEEIEDIENLETPEYSGVVFQVSVIANPFLDLPLFTRNKPFYIIAGYKGKELQSGDITHKFIEYEQEDYNFILRTLNVKLLELIMLNGSGHYIDNKNH